MRASTVDLLVCPARSGRCRGDFKIESSSPSKDSGAEIESGALVCSKCRARYPILGGVAVVVPHLRDYLIEHVKGISQHVQDEEIPQEHREAYLEAKSEIVTEHIEEDLEAERVNALYVMNHFLSARGASWWKPLHASPDPLIEKLVTEYWDQGPLARIQSSLEKVGKNRSLVELGCGVGGLGVRLAPVVQNYLGVDSSFASIALARRLALGIPAGRKVRIPEDLLRGSVSRELEVAPPPEHSERLDYVVGDVVFPPVREGKWDLTASLNLIDMLDEPEDLPALQNRLLREDGLAIQSCPYIWHPGVAEHLRQTVPHARDSATAVRMLYEMSGFTIEKEEDRIPWLFFKHVRQLEIYSVHLLLARKKAET